jgi:hypothetical protein
VSTNPLEAIKVELTRAGFQKKAILDDSQMRRVTEAVNLQSGIISTPPEELRYIEGLLDLPLGFLKYFKILPAKGSERCACGRVPSAVEIIHTALKHHVHDISLIRDTLGSGTHCAACR